MSGFKWLRITRLLAATAVLLQSSGAVALDNLEVSGFGMLGVALVDSERYGYRPDASYKDADYKGDLDMFSLSSFGLQLDFDATDTSHFTLQTVLKRESRTTLSRYISQAFYKYSLSPLLDIRVGRTALDLFALTEYRNVNFAYPWAVLPNEVYGQFPHRHLDGIDITRSFRLDSGSVQLKLFAGRTEGDIVVLGKPEEIRLDDMLGFSLAWGELDWEVKAGFTFGNFDNDPIARVEELSGGIDQLSSVVNQLAQSLPPGYPDQLWLSAESSIDDLELSGESVEYGTISGRYSWDAWTVLAELSRVDSSSSVVPEVFGSYLSLAYAHQRSTFYAYVANTNSDAHQFDDSQIDPLLTDPASPLLDAGEVGPVLASAFQFLEPLYPHIEEGFGGVMRFFSSNQTTFSLGWRYDLKDDIALNVQWNHTEIDDGGGTLWLGRDRSVNRDVSGESINTVFCTVSYIF